METTEVLRKIKAICKKNEACNSCSIKRMFCETIPEHCSDDDLEDMAKIINSYEEEEEKDV